MTKKKEAKPKKQQIDEKETHSETKSSKQKEHKESDSKESQEKEEKVEFTPEAKKEVEKFEGENISIKQDLEAGWENEMSSIRFWSFKNRPVFIGRLNDCNVEIQSKNNDEEPSRVFLFIEEDTQMPFYINQYTALKNTLEKEKDLPDENGELKLMKLRDCKKVIYKIQFIQERQLSGNRKFKEFNILTRLD